MLSEAVRRPVHAPWFEQGGRMDPRLATSHSSFAGCSTCFQQARLRSAPGGRRHVQVQCVEVKAPKDAEFGKESRIGKAPIKLPAGVTVKFDSDLLEVKGPKGQMTLPIPSMVEIRQAENTLRVFKTEESRTANCRHGLIRALASNMVTGVSEGWTKQLQLIGVGYRGTINGNTLVLNLGFSHPVEMEIPEGIQVKVEKAINVTITGYDKEQVGQFAATIRQKRPPEPYKQKGVRYLGEYIRKKEGKRGK